MAEAPFLGDPALFPIGPLLLAATLRAPVLLFFGLRTAARRYQIHFEPFAEQIILDRARRHEEIIPWARRYADRLAVYCRAHPFNWFNFYDFWELRADAILPSDTASPTNRAFRSAPTRDGRSAAIGAGHGAQ